jgi:hypothetical protein
LGDGSVSLADYVQAGRFAAGLDPVTAAGGPTGPVPPPAQAGIKGPILMRALVRSESEMRIANTELKQGQIGLVPIEFDAIGTENALSFTFIFEPGKAAFIDAVLDESVPKETDLFVNAKQGAKGRIGIVVGWQPGKTLPAGTRKLLSLSFAPVPGKGAETMQVRFDDSLVKREVVTADVKELPLPSYRAATVTIRGSDGIPRTERRRVR